MSNQEQETAKVYTPSTEAIRDCYVFAGVQNDGSLVPPTREAIAQFDRWLSENNRVVAAKALEDAADATEEKYRWDQYNRRRAIESTIFTERARGLLRARAAALRVQGETK